MAVVLWQEVHVLALDEPTNHLDLPSIHALEIVLDSCNCALIFVSHDPVFLDALVNHH